MTYTPMTSENASAGFWTLAQRATAVQKALDADAETPFTDQVADQLAEHLGRLASSYVQAEWTLVMHMRDLGITWAQIGRTLNVSASAVHQRFGQYDADRRSERSSAPDPE